MNTELNQAQVLNDLPLPVDRTELESQPEIKSSTTLNGVTYYLDRLRLKYGHKKTIMREFMQAIKFNSEGGLDMSEAIKPYIANQEATEKLARILFDLPRELSLDDCDADEVDAMLEIVEALDPLRLKAKAKAAKA